MTLWNIKCEQIKDVVKSFQEFLDIPSLKLSYNQSEFFQSLLSNAIKLSIGAP